MREVTSRILDTWQRCRRQEVLSREWKQIRWRPKELFTAAFRKAVFDISNGHDLEKEIADAKALFMQVGANPGLDVPQGAKPYQIAKDWCSILDTSLRWVARLQLLTLHHPLPINLTDDLVWNPTAWADDTGQLHRWIVTDAWTENDFYRELHSWHTFADVALLGCPMMLHILIIGQQRDGRRSSSWVRAFQHPGLSSLRVHFKKKDGTALLGWKPVFMTDLGIDPDSWIDMMVSEGECERLLRHIVIDVPSETVCQDTKRQIISEAKAMESATMWSELPMSRGACDTYLPCVFQSVCYSEKLVDIEELGFYKRTVEEEIPQ